MTDEQQIKVGQTWERTKDGTRVVITAYNSAWDDARWRHVDRKRGGAIYGCYLRARYRLVEDAA